jgi:broad specificity phosphatase PhoE
MLALMRHLPTAHDMSDVYTDWSDSPSLAPIEETTLLNVRHEIHEFVTRFFVQRIYVAANPRGDATAEALFPRGTWPAEVVRDERLNNIKQPEWAGKPQSSVASSPLYRQWHTDPTTVRFANGECLQDVANRTGTFIQETLHQTTLAISHTTPMQVICCQLLEIGYDCIWRFKFDHWSFTLFYQNILLRYNSNRIADVDLSQLKLLPRA